MQTIHLSEQEVLSFLRWRENQDVFELLLSNHVFDIKNGSAEIHFDAYGAIGSIRVHVPIYKKDRGEVVGIFIK